MVGNYIFMPLCFLLLSMVDVYLSRKEINEDYLKT